MAPPTGHIEKHAVTFETKAEEFFFKHFYHSWVSWHFFVHPLLYYCRPNQSPQSEHGSRDRGGKCFLAVEMNSNIEVICKKLQGVIMHKQVMDQTCLNRYLTSSKCRTTKCIPYI